MKKGALVLLLSLVVSTSFAQPGIIELGAGGGVSINSNPSDNMVYKGNRMPANYALYVNGQYNIGYNFLLGLEFRTCELARRSDDTFMGPDKYIIGGDDRKFVYAKSMLSATIVANGKLNVARGYFYGGAAVGFGVARSVSDRLNYNSESYRAADGGLGPVLGAQIGYVHGLTPRLGLNAEIALRHYRLSYTADAPLTFPYTDLKYNITAYQFTIGVKYRIFPKYKAQNNIPRQRGQGRSR